MLPKSQEKNSFGSELRVALHHVIRTKNIVDMKRRLIHIAVDRDITPTVILPLVNRLLL